MSNATNKLSAYIDRLEERLEDPKEFERMMQNPLAYGAFAMAALTPIAVVYEAIANGRFCWWALIIAVIAYLFGKALYIPNEKKNLPTAEEVLQRYKAFKQETERKIAAASRPLGNTNSVKA